MLIAIIIVVVILAAATAGWFAYDRRRLHASFGPELEVVAREQGGARQVDRELQRRRKRVAALRLTALSPEAQARYAADWEQVQGEFLNNPALALASAQQLVESALEAQGYPGEDPEELLALLSVEHANSLAGYRAARQVGDRARMEPESVPTEELRQAMLSCLALFNELLTDGSTADPAPSATRPVAAPTSPTIEH